MLIDEYHPEDIKAAIRKRYRSIGRFEVAENLAKGSVAEILRGRKSSRTEAAVRRIISENEKWGLGNTMKMGCSGEDASTHHLNERGK